MKRTRAVGLVILVHLVAPCACGKDSPPAAPAAPGSPAPAGASKTLHILNWSAYLTDTAKAGFKARTGAEIVEDYFSSPEELRAKLQAGGADYDVVVPSDYMVRTLGSQGLLERLDHAKLPNLKNIAPRFRNPASYDPQQEWSIPYFWGTVALGVNVEKVTEPVDSWTVLLDDRYKQRISLPDSARDTIGIALKLGGRSLNERDDAALAAAKKTLLAQKPLVKAYTSDQFKQLLLAEEIWLACGWSGELLQVVREDPKKFRYVIPREGTELWVDNLAIAKGCKEKDLAHAFLDYILEPEVIAQMATEYLYATPNEASWKLLPKEVREDPAIYPPPEVLERCEILEELPPEVQEKYEQIWIELKGA